MPPQSTTFEHRAHADCRSGPWAVPSDGRFSDGCCSTASSPELQVDSGYQSTNHSSEDELDDEPEKNQENAINHFQTEQRNIEQQASKVRFSPYMKSERQIQAQVALPKTSAVQCGNILQNPQQLHEHLIASTKSVLDVSKFVDSKCGPEAMNLAQLTINMVKLGQLCMFLCVFSHSISCQNKDCTKACLMFRRIRNHLSNLSHKCSLTHVYAQLTRMHVDTCLSDKCGFPTCKRLLAMRQKQNYQVLPRNFRDIELKIAAFLSASAKEQADRPSSEHVSGIKQEPQQETLQKVEQKPEKMPKQEPEPKLAEQETSFKAELEEPMIVEVVSLTSLASLSAAEESYEALDLSRRVSRLEVHSTYGAEIAVAN